MGRTVGRARFAWVALLAGCRSVDLPSIAIAPASPTSIEDLVAVPLPGEGEVWTWAWTVDGREVPDVVGDRVLAELTTRGETWAVSVVRHHGARESDPVTAAASIGNAPPVVTVRLTPDPPATGQPLAAVVEAVDPDDDPITLSYSWSVDGEPVAAEGPSLAGSDVRGDQVSEVTVTANDGEDDAIGTASAVTGNTAPRLTSVRIAPTAPTDSDELSVVWEGSDDDGDPLSVRIEWEVGGIVVFEGDTLSSAFFERADRIRAIVEPSDGRVAGPSLATDDVVIANASPTATGAVIVPAVLSEGVIASCELVGGSDPEGDPLGVNTRWFIGGTLVSTAPTLTGATFQKDDAIACEATPSDGATTGAPVLSPLVVVANTPPTIGAVTLAPHDPTAAGEVTAVAQPVVDSDGDVVTLDIDWYVDGQVVGVGPTWSPLVRGQTVQARVTAFDGTDYSMPLQSGAVVVADALPVVERTAMIPAFPTSADDVTADVSVVDADGDAVTTTIEWTVDGAVVFVGDVLPAGTAVAGDALGYRATPSDPEAPGAAVSAPEVVVGNGPPSLAGAEVTPVPLDPGDAASCVPVGATDPDGDLVQLGVLWWVNGVDTAVTPTLTAFGSGDVVRCELTPFDDAATGDGVWSDPVVVR